MQAAATQSLTPAGFQWLSFLAVVGAVIIGFFAVFFWALFFQKKRKRKRKHRGHGRIKPTLAEVGGLPEIRPREAKRPAGNPPAATPPDAT